MKRKERLPKYVGSFIDARGKRRYRFRRNGIARYFDAHPTSPAGQAEYAAYLAQAGSKAPVAPKAAQGTVAALLAIYYASNDFAGQAGLVTLAKRRAVLDRFAKEHGHRPAATATYIGLDKYVAAVARGEGGQGGPFAAQTARKELTRMFAYAQKIGWRGDNPMVHVKYRPPRTSGFHSWTEAEIAQYQAYWPLGTKQRLAMELLLWTGKRRGDAITLGPQHAIGGTLTGRDRKTGKAWELPIAPQLAAVIKAMPGEHLCFVPSDRGRAYSAASFGNAFRKWCSAAGLTHCTAHGLRKAISRRMADEGLGNLGIKAVTLHSRDDEVTLYTAAADQKRLARDSIARVAAKYDGLANVAKTAPSAKPERPSK